MSSNIPSVAQIPRVRIGVSSCLLGRNVRYDGGHKRMSYLTDVLSDFVEWVPVCPEVELGLGTPRDPINLVDVAGDVRLVMPASGVDHTDSMRAYAARRMARFAADDLAGYVLKSKSPSCGIEGVPIHSEHETSKVGRGLFADELVRSFPNLPIEDEASLIDAPVRENFIDCVFAYARLRALVKSRWRVSHLIDFHTAHKLVLMAHSPQLGNAAGRLLANAQEIPRSQLSGEYESAFMSCMTTPASVKKHTNVLHHIVGYLGGRLGDEATRNLLATIEDYRNERIPLAVPLDVVRNYVRQLDVDYLKGQVYIYPHPPELELRNHV